MRIAIHHCEGSFSTDWIRYCERSGIEYKLVNCHATDIVERVRDCDALMWHWHHADHAAALHARKLTFSLEEAGKKVFPSLDTSFFFDDKIGQKYLFEAIGVNHPATYVFYTEKDALAWVDHASFPKVFKLSRGAGGANVRLVQSSREARSLVRKAFGAGFTPVASYVSDLRRRSRRIGSFRELVEALQRAPATIASISKRNRSLPAEKGYVYFQEFLPDLKADMRVVVIGKKAFAILRSCLPNDFRASGSGIKDYSPEGVDRRCIEKAFGISRRLRFQSMAYDFVIHDDMPVLIEMSYTFQTKIYPGHFDEDLIWHAGDTNVAIEIIQNLIDIVQISKGSGSASGRMGHPPAQSAHAIL